MQDKTFFCVLSLHSVLIRITLIILIYTKIQRRACPTFKLYVHKRENNYPSFVDMSCKLLSEGGGICLHLNIKALTKYCQLFQTTLKSDLHFSCLPNNSLLAYGKNLSSREWQMKEWAWAKELCESKCESGTSKGVGLSQRTLQDWAKDRDLHGTRHMPGISMETCKSHLTPPEQAIGNELQRSRYKASTNQGTDPSQRNL